MSHVKRRGVRGYMRNAQAQIMLYYKTRLFKYIVIFTTKNEDFQIKNSDILHISALNIDCRYSLEPPRRGGSNE